METESPSLDELPARRFRRDRAAMHRDARDFTWPDARRQRKAIGRSVKPAVAPLILLVVAM
jgi:hypothetical protein